MPEEYKLAAHRTRETNTHTHTHTYTRGHRTQFGSRAFGLGEISRAPEQAQGPRWSHLRGTLHSAKSGYINARRVRSHGRFLSGPFGCSSCHVHQREDQHAKDRVWIKDDEDARLRTNDNVDKNFWTVERMRLVGRAKWERATSLDLRERFVSAANGTMGSLRVYVIRIINPGRFFTISCLYETCGWWEAGQYHESNLSHEKS